MVNLVVTPPPPSGVRLLTLPTRVDHSHCESRPPNACNMGINTVSLLKSGNMSIAMRVPLILVRTSVACVATVRTPPLFCCSLHFGLQ